MDRIAVFPGSFDPFTIGHKVIVDSAMGLFDKIYIAIGQNTTKNSFISLENKVKHIKSVFENIPNIEIITYDGLTADLCKRLQAKFIIRGLRNTSDFQYEKSIAQVNKELYPELETIFIVPQPQYGHISSTIVRDLIKHKGDVSNFVPGKLIID